MMASASTSGGGARPWRTALLTLRDESLASPSPTALLELLRRVLLSPASPSLAASAAALSPHEVRLLIPSVAAPLWLGSISLAVVFRLSVQVGSDVAFLADTAVAAASCPGADDAMRGVCHLVMVLCFRSVGLL
jgi:hypothetical protein